MNEPYAIEFVQVLGFGKYATGIVGIGIQAGISKIEQYFGETSESDEDKKLSRIFLMPAKNSLYPFGLSTYGSTDAQEKGVPLICARQIG